MSELDQQRPSSHHKQPSKTEQRSVDKVEAVGVARLCCEMLDREEQFHLLFCQLLTDLPSQNPFAGEPDADILTRLEQLTSQREVLRQQQSRCRRGIGRVLHCSVRDARLSNLEACLPSTDERQLRERRLRIASLLKTTRQLLRTTEVRLARHSACLADIVAELLGQPSSPNCYGADGRQSAGLPIGTLQAVS